MELRKTETRVIDGCSYEVTQLGAISGSRVFIRVLKLLGPLFAGGGKLDLGRVFENLNETDFEYLCNAFKPVTMVTGQGELQGIFDIHFTGRYLAMMQWLWFCLELNYGDFLKGSSLTGALKAVGPTASASSSAATPTGSPGVS